MEISNLKLYNFKNHSSIELKINSKVIAITGPNGSGKTNILDSIYYLANTKSYFIHQDTLVISDEEKQCSIHGRYFIDNEETEIGISLGEGKKKTIKKNGKNYQKLIDHVGLIQTVFITPYDIELVFDGSEIRRRFVDYTISQLNKSYLNDLVDYRKIIEQRNAYLKSLDGKNADAVLIDSFNSKLIPLNQRIFEIRKDFMLEFNEYFNKYHKILGAKEIGTIDYESQLYHGDFDDILKSNERKDIFAGRTTTGIHKDDLVFSINDKQLRKFGSQGQIKTFVIALKLAQFFYLKNKTNRIPILLLDDIFEKIDESRSMKLMELVCSDGFGQIWVSDTSSERVKRHFSPFTSKCEYISLPLSAE